MRLLPEIYCFHSVFTIFSVSHLVKYNKIKTRLIELEDRFQQQKLIKDGKLEMEPMDPALLAANERKADRSYKDKVMGILSGI